MKMDVKGLYAGRRGVEKVVFWVAVALLVYSLGGFFVLPALVKYTLVTKIPPALNRSLTIEQIRFNPYTLNCRLLGLELGKRQGPGHFVAFDELVVNLQAASLFKRALIVKNLTLRRPRLELTRHLDNSYNFSDLMAGPAKNSGEAPEPGGPLLFSINNIEIIDGEIIFDDRPKASLHRIEALTMAIQAISNLPYNIESYVQPAFVARINGTKLDLGGQVKPFADSQETSVNLKMAGIDIPSYLAYVPNETGLVLTSALVDLDVRLSFVKFNAKGSRLSLTGEVVVREVEIADAEQHRYLSLPRLTLEFGDANLLEKKVHLKRVALQGLALEGWRLENGDILPLALVQGDPAAPAAAPAPVPAPEADGEGDLVVEVDLFELTEASARFHDEATGSARPVLHELQDLHVRLDRFSTARDNRADLTFGVQVHGRGTIKGQGRFGLRPLLVAVDYELADLGLEPWQAYLQQRLPVAIAGGALASAGKLTVEQQEGGAAIAFQGKARLDKLALLDTIHGDDLLAWQSLRLEGIDFTNQANSLAIKTIGLDGLAATVIVYADGATTLSSLAAAAAASAPAAKTPAAAEPPAPSEKTAAMAVAIGEVKLAQGRVEFVDRKVRPSYAATLGDLHGTVTGLSSARDSQAVVDLSGKVNQHAPLAARGRINPLQADPFVDLTVDFRDLDLSHASPYTGTYVGYKTDKGKLNLDLHYLVDARNLTGKNKVFLDQFTLGGAVDSPDDMNLPINLAIALLTNRQGEISLDIPVSGNLDDPEFSLGGVVFQVLINLIAKAATSPFALLGSLIPDGEDLQTIAFEPGRADITDAARQKFDKIAYVLFERPGLRMDIMGQVAEGPDRRALARHLLISMMKLQKMQEAKIAPGDKAAEALVQLSPEEYERFLRKIFTLRLKASGVTPPPQPQSVTAMEDYVVAGIKVPDDQLRLLAIDRANQAVRYLAEQGNIAPERLFVVEPQLGGVQEEAQPAVRLAIK
jgi:uncharacterized protein involved in outer membrane biogenesis